jgi:MFS family permease
MPLLLIAIIAMLGQQTMASVAKTAVPVLFKPVADDIGFDPELVLLYTWLFACTGILVMLGCGAFITRFGALRMTQMGCVLMAIGLAVMTLTTTPVPLAIALLALVAGLVSMGATVSTPASSQILARYAPARWAPLVFSVKQAGVPLGVALAAFLAPILTTWVGWRGASLILAATALVIAFALEPCRQEFDKDRKPRHPLTLSSARETFLAVLDRPGLRMLATTAFAFIGLQAVYTNFTVVYLAQELGYGLEEAGASLAVATLVAAPGRIVWGWVSSVFISPRILLVGLAVGMSIGAVGMGFYDRTWGHLAVMLPLICISATALSWHGVLLSEVARQSPPSEVGRLTGGVLAFGTAGQIAFPLLFWLGYLLGDYRGAYIIIAVPAVFAALFLLRAPIEAVDSQSLG